MNLPTGKGPVGQVGASPTGSIRGAFGGDRSGGLTFLCVAIMILWLLGKL